MGKAFVDVEDRTDHVRFWKYTTRGLKRLAVELFESITDGSTTVSPVRSISLTGTGFTLTDLGNDVAEIDFSGGGGGGGPVRLTVGSTVTMLTTELNSLSNGSGCSLSSAFDNTPSTGTESGGWFHGDFELVLASMTAATANATTDLFIVPAFDGSNYSQGGTTAQPPNFLKGSWTHLNTTTARLVIMGVQLPPCPFKIFVVNRSGQAFASSGNTVKMTPVAYGS